MPTKLITAPTIEPFTLQEAKDHLRVDHTNEDAYISTLIKAVRQAAENFTSRGFINQTWDLFIDCFPLSGQCLEIPMPPLQSITSIKYIDTDGNQQTLAASVYKVDVNAEMGTVALAYGQTWPAIRAIKNAVEIRFVAGYGATAASVPEGIGHGMKMLLGHLYERRESTIVGVPITQVPQAYEFLLNPYVVTRFV